MKGNKLMSITKLLFSAFLLVGISFFTVPAKAEEGAIHVVEMLNKGVEGNMIFKPAVVFAKLGDTIHFEPTDKPHNAQSFKGMIPEGGTAFKTKMNKATDVVLDAEGVWGYFCQPHKGMGMVGLIVIGEETDISNAVVPEKIPPLAKKRLNKYIAEYKDFSNIPSDE